MSEPILNSSPPLSVVDHGTLSRGADWRGLLDRWFAEGPAVFLDSAGVKSESSRWKVLAAGAEEEFTGDMAGSWHRKGSVVQRSSKDLFAFLDEVGSAGEGDQVFPLNLASAWFGAVSYDFGKSVQWGGAGRKDARAKTGVPGFAFFKPSRVLVVDRHSGEYFCFGGPLDQGPFRASRRASFQASSLRPMVTLPQYVGMVRKAQDYIAEGDIYQANLAQSFEADWKGNPTSLYRVLREINPSPFMGLFQGREFTLVSSSPERLVAGRGGWLETRPIAGTRPRGADPTRDLQNLWELRSSPKEQAEHLMLVDLARNDLGRVAEYGTVEVKQFAGVESYAKVHHLVSIVEARLKRGMGVAEVFRSMFPAGTITGCPKVRCMEIIDELEPRNRGFYTGAMGYVAPGACFDFNILIRSFTLWNGGKLEFYAGAGIVADSDPEREYMETLYKVEALAQSLGTTVLPAP